jgi:ABC-2 type transport system permease protein
MLTLLYKEIRGFFSSLTGYVVIIVFLLANSFFMWLIPSEDLNILDRGYADLGTLFTLAPWIFLFLIPAITMRMFADEKKSGTIELLLTRPLSDMQIILAKYFASIVLVVLSLLPTLVFFWSVYQLGIPKGNIDMGGTWGSFIGLFFLASIYVAIGIFSSSITENQIVAFVFSAILCFIVYIGFESVSKVMATGKFESFFIYLGINEHYQSMSRGVLDIRDIAYFISAATIFILATRTVLQQRKW